VERRRSATEMEEILGLKLAPQRPAWAMAQEGREAGLRCDCRARCGNEKLVTIPAQFPPGILESERARRITREALRSRMAFTQALSLEERRAFIDGRRISKMMRDSILAQTPPEVVRKRGWKFSDEPVTCELPPAEAQEKAEAIRSSVELKPGPIVINHLALLQDRWHECDTTEKLMELEVVCDGLARGFNMGYEGPRNKARWQKNHKSATQNPGVLKAAIQEYREEGFIHGPFKEIPFPNSFVNPLGLREKSQKGKWRIVEDPSHPMGSGTVHDFTEEERISQEYDKIRDVLDAFGRAGRLSWFIVFDKQSAYRSLPMRAQDRCLATIFVEGFGYAYSVSLPFGFRTSGYAWQSCMQLFVAMLKKRLRLSSIFFWCDDGVILVQTPCAARAEEILEALVDICIEFRFMLHPDKFLCSRIVNFTGLEMDSVRMTVSIPREKRQKAQAAIKLAIEKVVWSRKMLQSLIGHAQRIASCLPSAKAFLGGLMALLRATQKISHIVPPGWAREDLALWRFMLEEWDGTALVRMRPPEMKPTSIFHIDAYGGRDRGRDLDEFCGVGICCLTTGEYSMVRFTPAQRRMAHVTKSYSTKILEFSSIVLLASTFANYLRGGVHLVCMDCEGAMRRGIKGYDSDTHVAAMCRVLSALLVRMQCFFLYQHILSQANCGDGASRGNVGKTLDAMIAANCLLSPSWVNPVLPDEAICSAVRCEFFKRQ
jgi:hypothetical protein